MAAGDIKYVFRYTERIRPSSPTPQNLRSHKLSLLDQLINCFYAPILTFYDNSSSDHDHNQLKKSFSRTLSYVYPLAGRLKDGKTIDCNDEGADFVVTQVENKMSEVMQYPRLDRLRMLFPCNPYPEVVDSTLPLLAVQASLKNASALASWDAAKGPGPCVGNRPTWTAVLCADGKVLGLTLNHMGLGGTIDVDSLLELPAFRVFGAMDNNFQGPLPAFKKLSALKFLYLSLNKFSGDIPDDAFDGMESLKKVHLAYNEFSGAIPKSLATSRNLIELMLEHNMFYGKIPDFSLERLSATKFLNNNLDSVQISCNIFLISTLFSFVRRKEKKLLVFDPCVKNPAGFFISCKKRKSRNGNELDWATRLKIVKGVARSMVYLYNELPSMSVPNGHLKSSNVLLDSSYEPLISDYGLLPIVNQEHAEEHMIAYKSPDYKQGGRVGKKTDVWALGVLILEILTGKPPPDVDTVAWVQSIVPTLEALDPEMRGVTKNAEGEVVKLLNIGLSCCEVDVDKRPEMKETVERIEQVSVAGAASASDDDFYSSYTSDDRSSRSLSQDFT
nr:pollen receptor-like kinase 2 [Ipomoea batatas]